MICVIDSLINEADPLQSTRRVDAQSEFVLLPDRKKGLVPLMSDENHISATVTVLRALSFIALRFSPLRDLAALGKVR